MSHEDQGTPASIDPARYQALCEFVFGEMGEAEHADFERELEDDAALSAECDQLRATIDLVQDALPPDELPGDMRDSLRDAAARAEASTPAQPRLVSSRPTRTAIPWRIAAAALLLISVGLFAIRGDDDVQSPVEPVDVARLNERAPLGFGGGSPDKAASDAPELVPREAPSMAKKERATIGATRLRDIAYADDSETIEDPSSRTGSDGFFLGRGNAAEQETDAPTPASALSSPSASSPAPMANGPREPRAGLGKRDEAMRSSTRAPRKVDVGESAGPDFQFAEIDPVQLTDVAGGTDADDLDDTLIEEQVAPVVTIEHDSGASVAPGRFDERQVHVKVPTILDIDDLIASCSIQSYESPATMFFRIWSANAFLAAEVTNRMAMAMEVSRASYDLMQQALEAGRFPLPGDVRTEEFLNAFDPDAGAPDQEDFAIQMELAPSLFNADPNISMLRITVRARAVRAGVAEANEVADAIVAMQSPVARDVTLKIEFDPDQVESFRQLGYENRIVTTDDVRDEDPDGVVVLAGHQVTALFEIVRRGPALERPLATVRLRSRSLATPDVSSFARASAEVAEEIQGVIRAGDVIRGFANTSVGYRRAILAAQFAELLRRSVHTRGDSLDVLVDEATQLAIETGDAETIEFASLVKRAAPTLRSLGLEASDELDALLDELCRLEYERGLREQRRVNGGADAVDAADVEADQALLARIEDLRNRIRALAGSVPIGVLGYTEEDDESR